MSKKVVILVIFVLLLIGGGLFYWQKTKKITGSPEDYVVLTTEQGKIVENKKAGLRVKVPEEWLVEKIDVMEGSMIFYSPDAEGVRTGKIRPPLEKGCVIETAVGYKKMTLDEIKKEAEELHKSLIMKSDEFEEIIIGEDMALKNVFDCVDLGHSITVYLPKRDKLYMASILFALADIGRCSKEFDKFLETVSIE